MLRLFSSGKVERTKSLPTANAQRSSTAGVVAGSQPTASSTPRNPRAAASVPAAATIEEVKQRVIQFRQSAEQRTLTRTLSEWNDISVERREQCGRMRAAALQGDRRAAARALHGWSALALLSAASPRLASACTLRRWHALTLSRQLSANTARIHREILRRHELQRTLRRWPAGCRQLDEDEVAAAVVRVLASLRRAPTARAWRTWRACVATAATLVHLVNHFAGGGAATLALTRALACWSATVAPLNAMRCAAATFSHLALPRAWCYWRSAAKAAMRRWRYAAVVRVWWRWRALAAMAAEEKAAKEAAAGEAAAKAAECMEAEAMGFGRAVLGHLGTPMGRQQALARLHHERELLRDFAALLLGTGDQPTGTERHDGRLHEPRTPSPPSPHRRSGAAIKEDHQGGPSPPSQHRSGQAAAVIPTPETWAGGHAGGSSTVRPTLPTRQAPVGLGAPVQGVAVRYITDNELRRTALATRGVLAAERALAAARPVSAFGDLEELLDALALGAVPAAMARGGDGGIDVVRRNELEEAARAEARAAAYAREEEAEASDESGDDADGAARAARAAARALFRAPYAMRGLGGVGGASALHVALFEGAGLTAGLLAHADPRSSSPPPLPGPQAPPVRPEQNLGQKDAWLFRRPAISAGCEAATPAPPPRARDGARDGARDSGSGLSSRTDPRESLTQVRYSIAGSGGGNSFATPNRQPTVQRRPPPQLPPSVVGAPPYISGRRIPAEVPPSLSVPCLR
jgi:hypothetical protein